MSINDRIKALRKEKGLNQKDFAFSLGLTQSGVSYMEQSGSNVSDSSIKLICSKYRVSEDWLRYGTGEKYAESDTFSLDEYAASHGCTDLDIDFLKAFFDLDPDVRNKVLDHFQKSLARRQQQTAAPTGAETRMAAMEKRIEELEKEEGPAPSPALAPVPVQSMSRSH